MFFCFFNTTGEEKGGQKDDSMKVIIVAPVVTKDVGCPLKFIVGDTHRNPMSHLCKLSYYLNTILKQNQRRGNDFIYSGHRWPAYRQRDRVFKITGGLHTASAMGFSKIKIYRPPVAPLLPAPLVFHT